MSTIKVRACLEIEVDRDAWDEVYGSVGRPNELREEVRGYVLQAIQESGAAEERAIVSVVPR